MGQEYRISLMKMVTSGTWGICLIYPDSACRHARVRMMSIILAPGERMGRLSAEEHPRSICSKLLYVPLSDERPILTVRSIKIR